MTDAIDVILPWVDGSDANWLSEKRQTLGACDGDAIRYRDWNTLRYVFRGIEQFLPFVRTVHFVTWGHLPPWLNITHKKLHIVNHRDYIPAVYLPTYNSNTIELNFHRIEGLADRFICMNDDMFFLRPLTAAFFFRDGLPADASIERPLAFFSGLIDHIIGNNLTVINAHFPKKETLRKRRWHWYSPRLKSGVLKNIYCSPFAHFTGFYDPHLPVAYLKSTFEAVWKAEFARLDATCRHRVRSAEDVNHWLVRYWQFVTGNYAPTAADRGRFFSIGRDDALIAKALRERKHPMICLNDDDPNLDFERAKQVLEQQLSRALPMRSAFEIDPTTPD